MVLWWCVLQLLATPAAAQPEPVLPLGRVECITAQRPDGTWTAPTCHAPGFAVPPEGRLLAIVHTHPQGSSLSFADLRLLARVDRITAVTRSARYSATRGPGYADLALEYPKVRARIVSAWAAHERAAGVDYRVNEDRINQQLARAGVIAYEKK